LLVSSIDWCGANNKIVTCSHDRNAFVWTLVEKTKDEPSKWTKSPVHLRIDRAAMHVKWSHDGLRFAVASGSKVVPLCTWDRENDWWTAKQIKKHKSTVLCVAFHPSNGQLLATGCADFKCRVISTYSGDVDGDVVSPGPFGTPVQFGESYHEFTALGWVNAVAWSPSGASLAFAAHDSSLHVATFAGGKPVIQSIRFRELPLNSILFVGEAAIIGGGHDFNPMLYTRTHSSTWALQKRLDERKEDDKSTVAASGVSAARQLFQNKTRSGQDSKAESDLLWTQHDNAITCLASASTGPGRVVDKVSSSGLDGRLTLWDLGQLEINLASLSL